jgi:hypothetical protein
MEPAALQQSEQKKLEELRRLRGVMDRGESTLTEI